VQDGRMEHSECILCGTCVDVCPTGVLAFSLDQVREWTRRGEQDTGLPTANCQPACESSDMRAAAQTIDEYIAGFPADVQAILRRIRAIIREEAPEAEEAIKYQLPTFVLHGNLVHFGAFQKHIGFYPTPSGTERFQKELAAYKGAKGSVQFPLEQPIPYDLIREIVRFRVQENRAKARAEGKKRSQ